MADEIRRSGRANKGHHTKNQDALDAPPPKPKVKAKADRKTPAQPARSQSAATPEDDDDDNAVIRCVCGDQRDIRGRQMIACDQCEVWQHVKCLGLQEGPEWEESTYYCEQCKPENHPELVAAIKRGEKPWNRKKGSKPLKAKQPRPSDGVPANEVDKTAQVVSPASTAQESAKPAHPGDIANGDAAPKSMKKDVSKSQPQSPTGEKRRRETLTEKDLADTKRRKSSVQKQEKATVKDQDLPNADTTSLNDRQQKMVDALVKALGETIRQASESRGYTIPDNETASNIANRLALQINDAAVAHFGKPEANNAPYVQQFKTLAFNVKKNSALVDGLLSGDLAPERIAVMSSEELASDEKQREYAALREANDKQVVLLEEQQGPRIRKTHKGEEIVEDENTVHTADQAVFTAPERRHRDSVQEESQVGDLISPTASGSPMRVELPEDVGLSRAPLKVDTSTPYSTTAQRQSSSNFDMNNVWGHVPDQRSPSQSQQAFQRRQSSIVMQVQQQGPGDDADVDRLLKDENNDVVMDGDFSNDPTICWQGTVAMQAVGFFSAVARFVAGGDFGQAIPWNDLLAPELPIEGRIDRDKGNEYICNMSTSQTIDISILSVTPVNDEGSARRDGIFHYFYSRNRWGVVPVERLPNRVMRDLYVIPIEAGGSNLPGFLDMLEHCTIETPRPEAMILLALVARLGDVPSKHEPTPIKPPQSMVPANVNVPTPSGTPQNNQLNGSSQSPAIPQPQFSPVALQESSYGSPYGSQGQQPQTQMQVSQYGTPPQNIPRHHQIPKAVEIFGPYINEPVVVQILSAGKEVSEQQMHNLRSIMDKEPAARKDMNVFQDHMKRHFAQQPQQTA